MKPHDIAHPFAGLTVRIKNGVKDALQNQVVPGAQYQVEDYWDRLTGESWMTVRGNPAAIHYAMRSVDNFLPIDDEVLYGKIGHLGHLVHVSEIELPQDE
jgi:hypothetical protein